MILFEIWLGGTHWKSASFDVAVDFSHWYFIDSFAWSRFARVRCWIYL